MQYASSDKLYHLHGNFDHSEIKEATQEEIGALIDKA